MPARHARKSAYPIWGMPWRAVATVPIVMTLSDFYATIRVRIETLRRPLAEPNPAVVILRCPGLHWLRATRREPLAGARSLALRLWVSTGQRRQIRRFLELLSVHFCSPSRLILTVEYSPRFFGSLSSNRCVIKSSSASTQTAMRIPHLGWPVSPLLGRARHRIRG